MWPLVTSFHSDRATHAPRLLPTQPRPHPCHFNLTVRRHVFSTFPLRNCQTLPDLFAIIKATEKLERAYVRDDVSAADYESACEKLIAQFRVLWGSMRDAVRGPTG